MLETQGDEVTLLTCLGYWYPTPTVNIHIPQKVKDMAALGNYMMEVDSLMIELYVNEIPSFLVH